MRSPVSIGLVGLGDSGLNLARVFDSTPQAELSWVCDPRPDVRLGLRSRFPNVRASANFSELLDDDALDAIVIATPASTHFGLVAEALEAEKHVLVERSLALSLAHAHELIRLAASRGRCLIVGQTMLFHPAVRKLKELVDLGELGDLFYLYGNRQSLTRVRNDENVLWKLGAQDIAVLLHLLEDQPIEVSARGEAYLQPGVVDVVCCYLRFATGISAQLHLSWLDAHERGRLTLVGSECVAVIDHLQPERQLTLYKKDATTAPTGELGDHAHAQLGDIICPPLPREDPLRLECEHFISAVRSPGLARARARRAAAAVGVLEALQRSLANGGASESLEGSIQPSVPTPLFGRPSVPRQPMLSGGFPKSQT
ncbi:MAG: Gfo/Idh/MocA family oxidoreductase [Actinobacteria bacterium]|nr:Gfo/Idh/MocA family oxidoreductase [Actinomycetota bacterium]